jgi:tyrosinase
VVIFKERALSNGLALRQDVEQADIPALRDAYRKLQEISGTDNRSWIFWCGIHGFPNFYCWHQGRVAGAPFPYDLFLPWHRAYLLYFDHVTRDQNEDAILPWWDWTSPLSHEIGVPAAYADPEVDGQPNPLFSGPTPDMPDDPARQTRRFPQDPSLLPTPEDIDFLLDLTSYVDFSQQLQDVHDGIHGWTGGVNPDDPNDGGDMGTIARAAFDPIFWAHHGMIDRLWYLWQLRHGVFNIPPSHLDRSLAPFDFTVEEVLDIGRLGYEYASSALVTTGPVG